MNMGSFRDNGQGDTDNVNGEILKIVVLTRKELPNVKVTLRTIDGETLCDDYLDGEITKFYPKNTISLTQEQVHVENYFTAGPLLIEIIGLGDGEQIFDVVIYYK